LNNIGSVRKRSKNQWEGRFYFENKRYSVYGSSRKECESKIKIALQDKQKESETKNIQTNLTFNQWFEQWLETYKKPYLKQQSLYGIVSKYDKYVRHSLGNKKMRSLDALDWQRLFNDMTYPATAKKLHSYIKSCYDKAIINKVTYENPMLGVDIKNTNKAKEKFVPTKRQLKELLDYLYSQRKELGYIVEFISLTGCRIGEACALTIDDIDFENKTIDINKSYNRYSKRVASTKTQNSIRQIPLFARAEEIIREYIDAFGYKGTIFHKIKSENLTNTLKYYAKNFGLKGLTPHSLRHYFSTLCREARIDEKVVQKWMGHSSVLMTLDTYTHVKQDFIQDQTSKLSSFLLTS